jgi:hypothetical protein
MNPMSPFQDFVWMLFCDVTDDGQIVPQLWNLVAPSGAVMTYATTVDLRTVWEPGDVMRYFPLCA